MITTDPLIEQRPPSATSGVVQLEQVSKSFGAVVALQPLTLEIGQGEFFSLLGSSGSGKTTTLRLIAGFEQPDTGRIVLSGRDVTRVPPYDRDVNTVFQDYALFPHMTVWDNIAYGLRARRVPKPLIARRVDDALALVRLEGFDRRRPAQLSGGQRQRVALARAIVNLPALLLLDEPLGALDLKLRREMQLELKRIQQQVGITFVYVTHDQDEALSMSDRLAVMNNGRLLQIGTPREVYDHPASMFIATFVGSANMVAGLLGTADGAHVRLALPGFERLVVGAPAGWQAGQPLTLAVRPERLRLVRALEDVPPGYCYGVGEVREIAFTGGSLRYTVRVGERDWMVIEPNARSTSGAQPGDQVLIAWDVADGIALLG
jgi:spermidine/putrescine transport system ATP-binding protein